MLAHEDPVSDLGLPALEIRALARKLALPALVAVAAAAGVLLAGGRVHAIAGVLRRVLDVSPAWAAAAVVFECLSLAGYVGLLSLVGGRATARVGLRESAQITFAGAAATRLLPTAGAGGLALALWALRRAGLPPRLAARTLLAFLVLLYSVFLAAIVTAGALLTAGRGPVELTATPAALALLAIVLCLVVASPRGVALAARIPIARLRAAAALIAGGIREALRLARSGDPRLAGAIAYWAFDAAVVCAMLHAFGSAPALPVVALAYFVGQVANTVPLPGSVSGGMAAALIAFGVPAEIALPSVLAYRTIAVWLPTPFAVAAVPRLRVTVAGWKGSSA